MTFTGDILLQEKDGEFDAFWENGQPHMTDGFETTVILAVFGDRNTWQNGIAESENEKIISEFPDVITNANVAEDTKNDGVEALKKALQYLVNIRAASKVDVSGRILSVYAIGWSVDIFAPDGTLNSRYLVNWEKGSLTAGYRRAS